MNASQYHQKKIKKQDARMPAAMRNVMSPCKHPPVRLYAWLAYNYETEKNDILCVGCCECGTVLHGGAE